jgi:hypothetical protein
MCSSFRAFFTLLRLGLRIAGLGILQAHADYAVPQSGAGEHSARPVPVSIDIGKAPAREASAEDRSLMPMLWLNNRMQTLQAQTSGSDLLSQH